MGIRMCRRASRPR